MNLRHSNRKFIASPSNPVLIHSYYYQEIRQTSALLSIPEKLGTTPTYSLNGEWFNSFVTSKIELIASITSIMSIVC